MKNIIAWTAWLYLTYVKGRSIIRDMSDDIMCQFLWCLKLKIESFPKHFLLWTCDSSVKKHIRMSDLTEKILSTIDQTKDGLGILSQQQG